VLLILFLGLVLLLGLLLRALVGQRQLRSELRALTLRFEVFERRSREERAAESPPTPAHAAAAPAQPAPAIADPVKAEPAAAVAEASVAPTPASPHPTQRPATPHALARIEEQLMRRWLIWLGALALALGAVFLVKYSIDQGYFGPTIRIASGVALGLALLLLGEWTRRHPASGSGQVNYIPAGLTAAGIVALFASVFAAYALYDLLDPLVAFILLAAIAAAAALLAVFHGRMLALLGFGGAYVVPLLVHSDHPSARGLLIYVLLVTAASLALLRWRGWRWLGWIITAGSMFWPAFAAAVLDDHVALGLYLCLVPVLIVGIFPIDRNNPARPGFIWTALAIGMALMFVAVDNASDDPQLLGLSVAFSAIFFAAGWRDRGFDRLPWLGALLQLAIIGAWHFSKLSGTEPISSYVWSPPPPIATTYLSYAAMIAAAFGIGGYGALSRRPNAGRWGFLSAATPLFILALAYWRMTRFGVSFPWAGTALALAAIELLAAETLLRHRDDPGQRDALAAYAVAMIGAIALGMTMSLRTAWLSVALALELPALVWLDAHLGVKAIRQTAMIMAAIVLVRLLLNPFILIYDFGSAPLLNGLLYAYGIPFIAFFIAARGFKPAQDELLSAILEGGTIALGVALVSLEIRHSLHQGRLDDLHYGLLEQGLLTDAWLAMSYGLLPRSFSQAQRLRIVAGALLAAAAVANLVIFPLLIDNPLLTSTPIGESSIFNDLLFAYAVPALLGVLFYRRLAGKVPPGWRDAIGIASSGLGFLYLSCEVRHWFHGTVLQLGAASDAEWYSYSAVWLIYSVLLMAGGIVFRQPKLRTVALGIGAIVAAKVFLFDMATLSGLYRAASFLGFGASLIGLGYLYQRLTALTAPVPEDLSNTG
jgi:uncharacterized membrane protein